MNNYAVYENRKAGLRNHSLDYLKFNMAEVRENSFSIVYVDPMPFEKMDINRLLDERIIPIMCQKKRPVQGTVVAMNIDGVTEAYYINKTENDFQGVYLPDFFLLGTSLNLFTGAEGISIEGAAGTYKAVESKIIDMKKYYLMVNEQKGTNVYSYIVDENRNMIKGGKVKFDEKQIRLLRIKDEPEETGDKMSKDRVGAYSKLFEELKIKNYRPPERKPTRIKPESERVSILARLERNKEIVRQRDIANGRIK